MRNTLKHLTLLTRMKDDGLLPALTGSFSEDAIAQACGQVETLQLQERLHIRKTKRIQEELVRVPNFAALYGALCRQEIGDEEIASVLESADGYGERLTAYPQEQVLAVMKLELLPSLRFEYLKYYFPFVMYEEEEQVILDNCSAAVLTIFVPYSFIDLMSGKYPTWMTSQICKDCKFMVSQSDEGTVAIYSLFL